MTDIPQIHKRAISISTVVVLFAHIVINQTLELASPSVSCTVTHFRKLYMVTVAGLTPSARSGQVSESARAAVSGPQIQQ